MMVRVTADNTLRVIAENIRRVTAENILRVTTEDTVTASISRRGYSVIVAEMILRVTPSAEKILRSETAQDTQRQPKTASRYSVIIAEM